MCEMIALRNLEVLAYTRIHCPNQRHFWNLSRLPVMECAYFLATRDQNEAVFNDYVELAAVRKVRENGQEEHNRFRAEHTYNAKIVALVDQIKALGGYDP